MRERLRTAWLHDLRLRGRHHVQAKREIARGAARTQVRPGKNAIYFRLRGGTILTTSTAVRSPIPLPIAVFSAS